MDAKAFAKKHLEQINKIQIDYTPFEWELSDEEWDKLYGNMESANPDAPHQMIDESVSVESTVALQALGYKKKDAERYMRDAIKEGASTVEEVIRYALREAQKSKKLSS